MTLIADRLNRISPSLTIAMTAKARALKAAGKDVIGLSSGEPDFDTPAHIREAGKRALDGGATHYGPAAGLPELREAIGAGRLADYVAEFHAARSAKLL